MKNQQHHLGVTACSYIGGYSGQDKWFFRFCIFSLSYSNWNLILTTISTVKSQLKKKTDAKSWIRLWMKSTYSSTSAPKSGQLG